VFEGERIQRKRCEETGKVCFDSPRAARELARGVRGKRIRCYRCEWCHRWHFGTKDTG
jgi:hypothetical protein